MSTNMTERFFDSKIDGVELLEPRFKEAGENAFDLCFSCPDEEGQPVEVFVEVSGRYGQGVLAAKTQFEIATEQLKSLGYDHGNDFSRVDELIGKPCRIKAKLTTKGNMVYYFTNQRRETVGKDGVQAKVAAILAQMKALKPGGGNAPAAAQAQASGGNPFD
jgi:hypothetical protein